MGALRPLLLAFVSAAVVWQVPARAAAQDHAPRCLAAVLPSFDSAQTRDDTVGLADRFLRDPPLGDRACGELAAGYALALSATPLTADWRSRQRAEDLLLGGWRESDGDPRVFLAFGMLNYYRHSLTDALRVLARGIDRRKRAIPPLTSRELALLHYIRGLVNQDWWRDYRSYGMFSPAAATVSCSPPEGEIHDSPASMFLNCPAALDASRLDGWIDYSGLRRYAFDAMVDEYEAVVRIDPTHAGAARGLLEEYLYAGDVERAGDLVRRLLRENPAAPWLLAAQGTILHLTGHDSLAADLFHRALTAMAPEERRTYEDISPLLTPGDSAQLEAADRALHQRAVAAFWNSLDPLYLTDVNERQVEHFARVTTVDVLFGVPTLGLTGRETDGGQTWLRYGRPHLILEVAAAEATGGREVYWAYPAGLRFGFQRGLSFRRNAFLDGGSTSNRLKRIDPLRGSTDLLADTVYALNRQLVRVRTVEGRPRVLLFTPWPAGFRAGTRVGLTVLDEEYRRVASWRGTLQGRNGVEATVGMRPGTFSLAFEVWDPGYRRLARVRDTVTVDAATDRLSMSDLLIATRIRPRDGRPPRVRSDLEILPSYDLSFEPGAPIGLYWEVYDLRPDSLGIARYGVITRISRGQENLAARVVRGLGKLLDRGPGGDGPRLEFGGEVADSGGRMVSWLELEAPRSPGEYRIDLGIVDRETGDSATAGRTITVRRRARR